MTGGQFPIAHLTESESGTDPFSDVPGKHIRPVNEAAETGVKTLAKRTRPGTDMTVHTEVMRDDADETETEKVEKLPQPEDLIIPAALLMAADSASDHKGNFAKYEGVFLHAHEGVGRIASSDGAKMFVASFKIGTEVPAWMTPGIIISNDGLKARIAMISKNDSSAGKVRLRFAAGMASAELTDARRTMAFQVAIVDEEFPDYERSIPTAAFANLDGEGAAQGREWEPVGINSAYLKHIGEIAKTLEAGLPKDLRSKGGMVVRAYNAGSSTSPLVFDFSTWPGVILIVGTSKLDTKATSPETAALLAPAIRLTLAALRAHETRNIAWAEKAEDDVTKANFLTKAEGFRNRVAEILKRAPGIPMLAAPTQDEPTAEVEFGREEPDEDDDEDEYRHAAE